MSTRHLQEKWEPILGHQDLPEIKDNYRKAVTAQLLENQEKFLREQAAMGQSQGLLTEAPTMNTSYDTPAGSGPGFSGSAAAEGPVAGFDPVLISLIRRSMPNLIAYDVAGVQPMSGPTGLIFAMRAMYDGPQGPNEALFDEADPTFSANVGGLTAGGTEYTYPNGAKTTPDHPYVPGQTPFSNDAADELTATITERENRGDDSDGSDV